MILLIKVRGLSKYQVSILVRGLVTSNSSSLILLGHTEFVKITYNDPWACAPPGTGLPLPIGALACSGPWEFFYIVWPLFTVIWDHWEGKLLTYIFSNLWLFCESRVSFASAQFCWKYQTWFSTAPLLHSRKEQPLLRANLDMQIWNGNYNMGERRKVRLK